jgi:uncharacterized membrane protein YkvA (DUF1232 family)
MIRATARREYDGLWRLALMAIVAIYLVSPLDFIADALFLIVGVIGDAALVTWLFGALMDEAERFLGWEEQRRGGAPAQRAVAAEAHVPPGRAKR